MLVTFYCDAYENIMYFGDIAQKLLRYMNYGETVPGAILAADVPIALQNLQQRIVPQASTGANISMSTRAAPLLKLLEAAANANCDVMWR